MVYKDSNCATILTGPATGAAATPVPWLVYPGDVVAGLHEPGYARKIKILYFLLCTPARVHESAAGVHEKKTILFFLMYPGTLVYPGHYLYTRRGTRAGVYEKT